MDIPIVGVLLAAAFYVGWNMGANDAANCIGTIVGARIICYRNATLLMAAFVILGGMLQERNVGKTVGKGIVIGAVAAYRCSRRNAAGGCSPLKLRPAGNAAAGCGSSPASRHPRSSRGFRSFAAATPSPSIRRIRAATETAASL